jgi:hypothetical protein
MSTKDLKKIIIDKLSQILKPLGYKLTGNIFSRHVNDITQYLSLQSSMGSTSQTLKITVNVEITSLKLYELSHDDRLPFSATRHFQKRIGSYQKAPNDKWWIIETHPEAEIAAEAISALIINNVFPELHKLNSTKALYDYWKTGRCAGLTEKARLVFLSLLEEYYQANN